MRAGVEVAVDAPRAAVWSVVTDIENAASARSHGSIRRTVVRVEDAPGGTRLAMEFGAEARSLVREP